MVNLGVQTSLALVCDEPKCSSQGQVGDSHQSTNKALNNYPWCVFHQVASNVLL